MYSRLSVLLMSLSLCACAATGSNYTEHRNSLSVVGPSASRLFIYRTGESSQASARSARINVDDIAVGDVKYKGFNVFDVPAGNHILSVDLWDAPGKCAVAVLLGEGQEHYYEVSPRKASFVAGMLGGVVGAAIESSGKECGGAFGIGEVSPTTAEQALQTLKFSR